MVRTPQVLEPVQTAAGQSINRLRVKTPVAVASDERNALRTIQKEAGPGAATATTETEVTWSEAGPDNGIGSAKTEKRTKKCGPLNAASREKSANVVDRRGVNRDTPPVLIMIMQRKDSTQEM